MADDNRPSERNSIVDEVARITGKPPSKILLRDSETAAPGGATPFVDPKSPDKRLQPRGRGNYEIQGEIARGGMGVILKTHDHDLGRDVALKVLDAELAKNPAVVQRFVEEAQVGGQLQHPGIVPVYELGLMADERPYFTMKLVKGRTLAAILSERRSLEDDRLRNLTVFEAVCQTVAYAHSKGVIHRDIKPSNIMVGAFGEVQVVDWGLAKVLRGGGVADEERAKLSDLTVIETVRSGSGSTGSESMVGSVMGTPAYMSPEQAAGSTEKLDERSDVFLLGATLCELLTGSPPYRGEEEDGDRAVVQAARARLDPALERIAKSTADEELKELCTLCLMPGRAARPHDAGEVASRVHAYLESLEERTRQADIKAAEERRGRQLWRALAATIVIAVGVVGGTLYVQESSRRERMAKAEQALDEAQTQVLELQAVGQYGDALDVARSAVTVATSSGADATLRGRAQRLEDQALAQVDAEARRVESGRRDQRLLDRLDDLRLRQVETLGDDINEELDAAYTQAFREHGIDLDDEQALTVIVGELRESPIAVEVALGLDDWASVRRALHPVGSYGYEAPTILASDLDPDPRRMQIRQAILQDDPGLLIELQESGEAEQLPPETLWVLSTSLFEIGRNDLSDQVVRGAALRFPDDFRMNVLAGTVQSNLGNTTQAVRHLTAACALRPENPFVHAYLGGVLWRAWDLLASVQAYEVAWRVNPERIPDGTHGWSALFLGDAKRAVEVFERRRELLPGSWSAQHNVNVARFMLDEVDREEMLAYLGTRPFPMGVELRSTASALCLHPDPAKRDPEKAMELFREFYEPRPTYINVWVWTLALVSAGHWEEALEALEVERARLNSQSPGAMAMLDYKRAIALASLGRREEAEVAWKRGEQCRRLVEYQLPERWQGSCLHHLQREAKAALGL